MPLWRGWQQSRRHAPLRVGGGGWHVAHPPTHTPAHPDRLGHPRRPALYRGLLSLLADPNAAVALSGLDALAALVADISFDEDVFAPLLPSCLALLLRRLATSQQLDSQKQVRRGPRGGVVGGRGVEAHGRCARVEHGWWVTGPRGGDQAGRGPGWC